MKLRVISILLVTAFCGCTSVSPEEETLATDGLIIRTGTSFGMCVGYCVKEYVLNGTSLSLTQKENLNPPKNPARTCQKTISQEDWSAIKAAANFENFSKLPERIGCPDCADGGAEYIELEADGRKHRVTFEHSSTIPGSESLVNALRAQREAFNECN